MPLVGEVGWQRDSNWEKSRGMINQQLLCFSRDCQISADQKPSKRRNRRGERTAEKKERKGWRNTSGEHPGERWTAPVVRSWEGQWWWFLVLKVSGSPRLQSRPAPCVASHFCYSAVASVASTWWSPPSLLQRERERRRERESNPIDEFKEDRVWGRIKERRREKAHG